MMIALFGVCLISVQTSIVNTDKVAYDSVLNSVFNPKKPKINPVLRYEVHGDEYLIHFDLGTLRMDFTVPKNTTIDLILKKFIKTAFNSLDYWSNLKEIVGGNLDFLQKTDLGNIIAPMNKESHTPQPTLQTPLKPTTEKTKHTVNIDLPRRPFPTKPSHLTKIQTTKTTPEERKLNPNKLDLTAKSNMASMVSEQKESFIHRIADDLFQKIHIVCLVMTTPEGHRTKAVHVKATWGRRCNTLLFMSSEEDASLPTVKLPVVDDQDHLWLKVKEAFRYVYKEYHKDADWILKVDDDSYIIMENLRYLLVEYNSTFPFYLGDRKFLIQENFLRGSAGYVLSRGALERFVNQGPNPPSVCRPGDGEDAKDIELSICLDRLGCTALESQDTLHRSRFFSSIPREQLATYNAHNHMNGFDCCSDYVISFKHVQAQEMYTLEYLIYRLKTFSKLSNPSFLMV